MIIHFRRPFHSPRHTSNCVWSLSFLTHRMSWVCAQQSYLLCGSLEWGQEL